MTEADWLESVDPGRMLAVVRGKISDRKLRLFGCACCRRIWQLLPDPRSRRAVESAERLADGLVAQDEAEAAGNAAAEVDAAALVHVPEPVGWRAARAVDHLLPLAEEAWQLGSAWEYVATAMEGEQLIAQGSPAEVLEAWSEQSVESGRTMGWTDDNPEAWVAGVLREVLGNPFHPVAFDARWGTADVMGLARGIYEDRAFDRMPLLGDALSDAGCDSDDILGHCRGDGPHVRGCWVVDLVLGKG
jgi:hypothetical protein